MSKAADVEQLLVELAQGSGEPSKRLAENPALLALLGATDGISGAAKLEELIDFVEGWDGRHKDGRTPTVMSLSRGKVELRVAFGYESVSPDLKEQHPNTRADWRNKGRWALANLIADEAPDGYVAAKLNNSRDVSVNPKGVPKRSNTKDRPKDARWSYRTLRSTELPKWKICGAAAAILLVVAGSSFGAGYWVRSVDVPDSSSYSRDSVPPVKPADSYLRPFLRSVPEFRKDSLPSRISNCVDLIEEESLLEFSDWQNSVMGSSLRYTVGGLMFPARDEDRGAALLNVASTVILLARKHSNQGADVAKNIASCAWADDVVDGDHLAKLLTESTNANTLTPDQAIANSVTFDKTVGVAGVDSFMLGKVVQCSDKRQVVFVLTNGVRSGQAIWRVVKIFSEGDPGWISDVTKLPARR